MFKRSPVQRLGVDEIGRTHRHEQVRKVSYFQARMVVVLQSGGDGDRNECVS